MQARSLYAPYALAICGCVATAAPRPTWAPPVTPAAPDASAARGTLVLELREAGTDSLLDNGLAALVRGSARLTPDLPAPGYGPTAWIPFRDAPAGAYDADVRRIGFLRTSVPVEVRAGRIDTVRVRLGRQTCDLDCHPVIVPAPPQ